MLRSLSFVRVTASLALLLPLGMLGSACGDDTSFDINDGGKGSDTGKGGDGGVGVGNDGGNGSDGGNGGDGGNSDGSVVTPDTTPPTVASSDPAPAATGVSPNGAITVTFSEPMNGPSVTGGTTFTVTLNGATVAGTVSYADGIATFVPDAPLALDSTYTIIITTAAKDAAGNAMQAMYTSSFKTDASAPAGPAPVLLGTAGKYVVLAKSAITNVPMSHITGSVGISPAAASYITGFSMTKVGTYWTSTQVVGKIFAADNDVPTPSNLTVAIGNMETAYTNAAGRVTPDYLNLGSGDIGGATLMPGLYKWTSTVTIPDSVVISGGANDVWIFQVTGDVMMAANKSITLMNGARAKNVFWQVTGLVDLGVSAHAEGIMLSKTAIKLGTGASINGRLLAQTAVNLAGNTIVAPAP